MNRILIVLLGGLFNLPVALAEDVPSLPTPPAAIQLPSSSSLSPTQQWLELQRSGKAASAQAQPVTGEVMDKVHTRYLKSFEKPIPEFFEHEMRTAR
ncbi:DUF3613 domain-containing protein [Methylophilus flavus]|uniref:DUF3613 domain-containing protein n=1 Tax=Methylophilus flavus TaxID=640084 RepID=A0ABW3PF09_9PROT